MVKEQRIMGYSCETLGLFPFTPVNIDTIETSYSELLGEREFDIPITIFPGISTFVGGDITSGMLACRLAEEEKISILIDLGTNGEMAIGNKDHIIVTSTAAGPAFEGGNITYGMGSVPGAICSVKIKENQAVINTIGDKPPIGICGTGAIETVCELVKVGLVDETGLLEENYFLEGFPLTLNNALEKIFFTQKDIREIQLAKSAIRAGIEILLRHADCSYEMVEHVYLAGGFGYKMDIQKAVEIGMLPMKLQKKIKAMGNTSLSGTIQYLHEADAKEKMAHIIDISKEINLSNDKNFNELYMEYMYF